MARKKTSSWKDQRHTLEQRRDAVAEVKAQFAHHDDEELCRELARLKDKKDELDLQLQRLSEQAEAVSEILSDRWVERGVGSHEVDGQVYSLVPKLYVSAKEKEVYHQWLKDNGMEVLIQPTVAAKTTESLVRERLEQGLPCEGMGLNVNYKMTVR